MCRAAAVGELHHQHRADREVRGDEDVRFGAWQIATARPGSKPVVPITTCTPAATASRALASAVSGTVKSTTTSGRSRQRLGERRAERRVGARRPAPCRRRPRRRRTPSGPSVPRRRRRRRGSCSRALHQRGLDGGQRLLEALARRGRCRRPTGARARTARRPATTRSSSVTASIRSTISSTDSSGIPASTSEPSRFMRAPVDSSDSTTRPLRFSLARSSSSGGRGLLAQPPSSVPTTASASVEVLGARADVQPDLAGVGVGARERVHRVGQPATLAHLLEQARGRGAAEDRVEHAQREAPLVVARERRPAEAHVVLLGVLALEAATRGQVGRARRAPTARRRLIRWRRSTCFAASSTSASWSTAPAAAITTLAGT